MHGLKRLLCLGLDGYVGRGGARRRLGDPRGIAGVVFRDPERTVDEARVRAMCRVLAHRGPDAEGVQRIRDLSMDAVSSSGRGFDRRVLRD